MHEDGPVGCEPACAPIACTPVCLALLTRAVLPPAYRLLALWLLAFGLLVLVLTPRGTSAQDARTQRVGNQSVYSVALVGVPLADALQVLIEQTAIDLLFDSDVVAGRQSYCRARDLVHEDLLRCVLDRTGLDYVRLSNGAYVVIQKPKIADRTGRLSGTIIDDETGAPLPRASVVLDASGRGVMASDDGRFAIVDVTTGTYQLAASHVAYDPAYSTVSVAADSSVAVTIRMSPRIVTAMPVVVDARDEERGATALGGSSTQAPEVLDEPSATIDPLRAVTLAVGVHSDGLLSDMHIQGSASGEHRYMLDGTSIFVPVRNGGLVGPFSPLAIRQITIHKAGYAARYGSHPAGVVEIEHALGSRRGVHVAGRADPVSFNARASGSVALRSGITAQWAVSGRRALWDWFRLRALEDRFRSWSEPNDLIVETLGSASSDPNNPDDPSDPAEPSLASGSVELDFTDLHAAARFQRRNLSSIYVSAYHGRNVFGNGALEAQPRPAGVIGDDYRWTNRAARIRYEWVPNGRTFAHVEGRSSSYSLRHPFAGSPLEVTSSGNQGAASPRDFNEIDESTLSSGLTYHRSRHVVEVGLEGTLVDSDFSLRYHPSDNGPIVTDSLIMPSRLRVAGFVEDVVTMAPRTKLTVGSRLTWLANHNTAYAEPRIALTHEWSGSHVAAWALRLAGGRYRQFIEQVDVASYSGTALIPTFRFWIPLGADVVPSKNHHASLDVQATTRNGWRFRVETYLKQSTDQLHLNYALDTDVEPETDFDGSVVRGDARAAGIGVAISRAFAVRALQAKVDASYEFMRSERRIEQRFGGAYQPAPWEVPHAVRLGADLRVGPWSFVARMRYAAGRSWAFLPAYYDYLGTNPSTSTQLGFDLTSPGLHDLPIDLQLDAGITYRMTAGTTALEARITVINVLNRRNVTHWVINRDEASDQLVRQNRFGTPLLPLFSIQLTH